MNEESHNPNREDNIEPELEARIIALVLGEASDFETEELHRLIAQRPELAAFKQRMESMHGLLLQAGAGEFEAPSGEWKLPSNKRNAVLAAIRGEATIPAAIQSENPAVTQGMSARRRWRWKLAATLGGACLAGFIGVMAWPSLFDQSPDATLVASNQSDALGFELRGGTNLTFEVDSINNMDDWYARGFSNRTRIHGMSEDVSIDRREISPADAGSLSSSKASTDALSAIHDTLDAKATLPGDTYLDDDVQYFDDGPEFQLSNESVVQQATIERERSSRFSSSLENEPAAKPQAVGADELVAKAAEGSLNLRGAVSGKEMQDLDMIILKGNKADAEKVESLVEKLDRQQAVAENDVASALGVESIAQDNTTWMFRDGAAGRGQEGRTSEEKLSITMPKPQRAAGVWVEETNEPEVADRLESVLGELTTPETEPMSGLQANDGLALLYDNESKPERLSESREELAAALNQSPIIDGFNDKANVTRNWESQTVNPAVDRFRFDSGKQSNTSGSPVTDLFTLNGEPANSQNYNFQAVPETVVPETGETEADSALPPIAVPNGGSVTLGGVVRPSVALERQGQENIAAVNVPEMTVTPRIIIGEQEVPLMLGFAPDRASGLFEDGTIRANGQVDSPTTAGGMGGGGFGGGGTAANSVASKDSSVRPIELQRSSPAELLGRLGDTLSRGTDVDADADGDGLNMPVPEDDFIKGTTIAITESEPSAHPFAVDASGVNAEKQDAIALFGRANGLAELADGEQPVVIPSFSGTTTIPELPEQSDLQSQLFFTWRSPADFGVGPADQSSILSNSTNRESLIDLSKKAESQPKSNVTKTAPVASLNEKVAANEAFSTFSLHVSDVSFKLALAALAKGEWPEAAKVRIEEFVNAFDYGDPMPANGEKVTCAIEQSIHPFVQQRNLLRVSMRTAAAGRASQTPLRLTFLLDNSGSMERIDRQQTVRRAFAMLAQQLTPIDQVTLISFARQSRLLADKVGGADAGKLVGLIDELPSEGGTNIEAALQLAFEKAREQQTSSAQNRIILLTDGAVNLGNANPESLSQMVTAMRNSGIAFDAAGISADGLNDEVLEALARKGDGRYYLLDSLESADDGFAKQIAGALRPSAKNVKVQVEFNSKRVGKYKLLGFEKHILKKEDFRNDSVDAAEMAAAEAGVAMYQFEALPDGEGDVGSVSVRFQDLSTGEMVENRWPIPYQADAARPDQAAPSLRIATSAAMLAAKLRWEPLGESVDLQVLSGLMSGLPEQARNDTRVQQLQQLIEQARQLSGK